MGRMVPRLLAGIIAVSVFFVCGCATIRTMPYVATPGSPKIYSGARLDYHAIAGTEEFHGQGKVEAPIHPLIDFPFSTLFDTAILLVTVPVATYEFLFEK
jgi:uncharacterized protein YceK